MRIFPSRYVRTPIIYRILTPSQLSRSYFPKIVKDLQDCPSLKVIPVPIHSHLLINCTEGFPRQVRMAHLAVIGSCKVNGVAEVRWQAFLNIFDCDGHTLPFLSLPSSSFLSSAVAVRHCIHHQLFFAFLCWVLP